MNKGLEPRTNPTDSQPPRKERNPLGSEMTSECNVPGSPE